MSHKQEARCDLCGLKRSAPRHNKWDMQGYHPFEETSLPRPLAENQFVQHETGCSSDTACLCPIKTWPLDKIMPGRSTLSPSLAAKIGKGIRALPVGAQLAPDVEKKVRGIQDGFAEPPLATVLKDTKTYTFVVIVTDKNYSSPSAVHAALESRLDGWDVDGLEIKRVMPDHEITSAPTGFIKDLRELASTLAKRWRKYQRGVGAEHEINEIFIKHGVEP